MMFVIEGHDGPGAAALRAWHLDAHVAHLRALGEGFVIGGPFLDQNNASIGSLVVVDVTDRAAAEAFAAADPFVLNKVFERVEIRRWDFGHLRQKGRG
jgi:uncharacterized protein YciI